MKIRRENLKILIVEVTIWASADLCHKEIFLFSLLVGTEKFPKVF